MRTTGDAKRRFLTRAAAAAALALLLSACSSAIDSIPTALGGLPEGVPSRPATPAPYPAVHDMPPRRPDVALSQEERKRLRQELILTRDRTEKAGTEETTGATATTATGGTAGTSGKP